ncbi:uncharacterized protein RHOBADRAFT_33090 [Rhodotorula graminis WP1]|uniref:Nuclear proteasome inhibitor UBLCP1 n=1 Tax=Rhodotorula graminis (strain WP1) TaxID=578459 RepID=A0A194SD92_RHOGW|nr:uncharacterized protein RHOBADRAFT_33090 [Rhodotorula graminis WP1]KPV78410.1 hypothetical protein RHOBADRAFT_33090 [Rhodotorula graminis WP1]
MAPPDSTSAPAGPPTASTSTSPDSDSPGAHVLADSNLPTELPSELSFDLVFSWRGQKQAITVQELDTVGDLKMLLWSLTSVPPERQKIVGLVKGKLPGDEQEVVELGLGNTNKKEFLLVGTPEGEEAKAKAVGPSAQDEADVDYAAAETRKKADQAVQSARNRRKLKEAADKLELSIMAPPRPGKKLLVLDLDGCILDTSLWKHDNFAFPTEMFARPYLHDFLRLVSPHYDIMPWSQTSWRWLESKLAELSMIGPTRKGDYHIVSTVDRTPMFSIYSERDGKPFAHEVKALGILWAKFPGQYSAANTIHVDDLSRNFALNIANGLKVKAYKDALTRDRMSSDKELLYVARYLLQIADHDDLTQLDHSRFKHCKRALPPGVSDPLKLAAPSASPQQQGQPATTTSEAPPPPPPPGGQRPQ